MAQSYNTRLLGDPTAEDVRRNFMDLSVQNVHQLRYLVDDTAKLYRSFFPENLPREMNNYLENPRGVEKVFGVSPRTAGRIDWVIFAAIAKHYHIQLKEMVLETERAARQPVGETAEQLAQ